MLLMIFEKVYRVKFKFFKSLKFSDNIDLTEILIYYGYVRELILFELT